MFGGEFDGFLNVFWRSGIDADDWYTPLLAWNTKCSVEVAGLDSPVGKRVGFPLSMFSSSRMIRTPNTIEPASTDIRAVP